MPGTIRNEEQIALELGLAESVAEARVQQQDTLPATTERSFTVDIAKEDLAEHFAIAGPVMMAAKFGPQG